MKNKILIEIVTAQGCAKCKKANEIIRNLMKDVQGIVVSEMSIIENPEIAVKYKLVTTPSIIINRKLEFTGIPDKKELKIAIEKYKR